MRQIKFIDLFCGIGGFRFATESAAKSLGIKADCVFSSDIDKYARESYKANFGEYPFGDITKIEADKIPDHDLLLAGFPCQAFSISGKKLGFGDTRGTLFFEVARIARERQPKMILLENVKNLVTHDSGQTIKVIMNTLDEIGYTAFHKVLNAVEYGLPQKRERVFIVCFRKDMNIHTYSFPKYSGKTKSVIDIVEKNIDLKEFMIDRNDIKLFTEQRQRNNTKIPIRIGIINKGGQGERIYNPIGVGITLSAYGGGAASKTGAYLIDNCIRKLTPRECARLMGFPEKFKIHQNKNQAYKQFGNSIAVNVAESICENIFKRIF